MDVIQTELVKRFFVNQEVFCDGDIVDESGFLTMILQLSADDIFSVIYEHSEEIFDMNAANIIQFSNKEALYSTISLVLNNSLENYRDLGEYLCTDDTKTGALVKFAENHYKLAVLMGLAYPVRKKISPMRLTKVGKAFDELTLKQKNEAVKRLCMRIPSVQHLLLDSAENSVGMIDIVSVFSQCLLETTAKRRTSNMRTFLEWMQSISNDDMLKIISNVW